MPAIDRLAAAARRCDHKAVQPLLGVATRRLRAAGVVLSDRRVVRAQRLVAAAAILDGRDAADAADLWVLPLVAPTADAQVLAREALTDLVADSANASLPHAAEEYSRGPRARAHRLAETGRALLAGIGASLTAPDSDAAPVGLGAVKAPADRDTLLRVEATLREIDAAFAAEDLPPFLAEVRGQLITAARAEPS